MSDRLKQFGLRMISGDDQSLAAKSARIGASIIEPFYAGAMAIRNACYDRGIFRSFDLGRPTISVGNITTGGTGKTPVVQWLADQLRQAGRHPAILLRGYGDGSFSDEAQLLDQALNSESATKIPVQANPSRIAGAAQVLNDHPTVDVFILDDAFQHRKVCRNFNLVLISATQPFGFGHVLPRGLLRESLSGLKRADAFLITRCSLVPAEKLAEIDRRLRDRHPAVPVYRCDHHIQVDASPGQKVFVTAGIGDPAAFAQQIVELGFEIVGTQWFADHHFFTEVEINAIQQAAKNAGASVVLTTEKDWMKIRQRLPQQGEIAITVIELQIGFPDDEATVLLSRIKSSLSAARL